MPNQLCLYVNWKISRNHWKYSMGVWIFLLVSDTLFNINQRWKLVPIFVEVVEQYIFFSVTGDISGPFRQIWNLECLQFRVETELLYDLKVGCMCLNNLSGYTSDYSVFYNWKKYMFDGE